MVEYFVGLTVDEVDNFRFKSINEAIKDRDELLKNLNDSTIKLKIFRIIIQEMDV